MPPPSRTLLTRDKLNQTLTDEIRRHDDLEDATLHAGQRLASPDATGCNWSSTFVLNAGSNATKEYAEPIAAQIIMAARAKYNIAP